MQNIDIYYNDDNTPKYDGNIEQHYEDKYLTTQFLNTNENTNNETNNGKTSPSSSLKSKKESKKRNNKKKEIKQNEKEILKNYANEQQQNETSSLLDIKETKMKNRKSKRQIKSNYENMEYLSTTEKKDFENKFVKPKNKSQELYVNELNDKDKKIIIAIGPAGTGKTLFATQYGIRHFLLGNYDKLLFTRPTVSVDEDIGFLPGTMEEKLSPWLRPIFDILYDFISVKEIQCLIEEKIIEIAPIGYLRGRTFKNTYIIADEMQNCTQNQMKMLLTRLGENSRMIITGDLEQHDRIGEINGLADFLNKFKRKRSNSISMVEFEQKDILREPVIKEILEIYSIDTKDEILGV